MSDRTVRLFWNGEFVVEVTNVKVVDWPWRGGEFEPGTFPKELADAIGWWWDHRADTDKGNLPEGLYDDWILHAPDGTIHPVSLGWSDLGKGSIQWR